ncbi:hypothetical protein Tco_0606514 [Tanacetum coccineum]
MHPNRARVISSDEARRYGDDLMFDTSDLANEEVFVAEQGVPDSKKDDVVSTAGVATTVTKPKVKGIIFKEPVESTTTTTTIVSSQQPSQVKVQDKGKGKMVEPEKPMKKKELIRLDEEISSKLQAEFDEEVRLARKKAEKEEEANIVSWDNVQVMIDADYQMAQQMQAEEQEKLSIKKKSKLFVQLLEAKKKHFAAMRAQEKRNKPPTKAQKRKIMSTYLKNMAGYKHNQVKNKSFDYIQKLFDKVMKRVNTFVDMDKDVVEGSEVRAEGTETRAEVDEDRETAELKRLMVVMTDEEEVALDAIPLVVKSPSIVDWIIHKEGKKSYYQIIRADGSSKMYLVFSHMLKSFDREDLETLYKLVKAKYGSTRPVEDLDSVLYGDLKTMFKPHVEDNGRIVGIKRLLDDLEVTAAKVCVTAAKQNGVQDTTYGFTPRIFDQSPQAPNPPLNKKDSSLEEILDDLFRIVADNLRMMEHEVPNRHDEETVGDTKHESGNLLNFLIFPVTNKFASVCIQDDENINVSTIEEIEEVHVEDVEMDENHDVDHSNTNEAL